MNRPSANEIDKYLKLWDSLEIYVKQESSLRKLFISTYPLNDNMDDVLIKVCALNDFYRTNIFSPFFVAKHIVFLNIDESLRKDDINIVNKIAKVPVNTKKTWYFYSFATKYCSHHKPTVYPIYDTYVEKMLKHFKRRDRFTEFKNSDLRDYPQYHRILQDFRVYYNLEKYDLKQIDKYLWQAGKKHFNKSWDN